jgi:predicted nucleotidyltransferase component of viral defense system
MISRAFIKEWSRFAPWQQMYQVEQDLIISRALVELFNRPLLAESLAFRGGTALFKLYLAQAVIRRT